LTTSTGSPELALALSSARREAVPISLRRQYHNLHRLAPGAQPGQALTDDLTFESGDDKHWGFLEITVHDDTDRRLYTAITSDEQSTPSARHPHARQYRHAREAHHRPRERATATGIVIRNVSPAR
jgi:hypothetical protein